jgi:hypothetical protein
MRDNRKTGADKGPERLPIVVARKPDEEFGKPAPLPIVAF